MFRINVRFRIHFEGVAKQGLMTNEAYERRFNKEQLQWGSMGESLVGMELQEIRGESGIKYFSSDGKKDVNLQKRNSDDSGESKGLLEILEKGLWEWV